MFKIRRDTVGSFSFEEILLMIAINEVEVKRTGASSTVKPVAKAA
jgi:hypothetical protein